MKFSGFLVVAAILALASAVVGGVAQAQSLVDPKIGLGGTGSCASFTQFSLTQSFEAPTGCIVDFNNQILGNDDQEITLTMLVVNVTSPFSGPLSCGLNEGAPLTADPVVSSPTSCTFSDPIFDITGDSIHFGDSYGLTFDPNFGGFVDITLSQTVITPTPEPATLFLIGSGFLAFATNRKRLNGHKQSA